MISFAIIGIGNIGSRHAQHILNNPEAQLTAVCDIDLQKEKLAQEWGVPYYENIDSLLTSVKADVICICVPNYLHHSYCIKSLEAGFHALVEKPMALSVQECDEMIANSELTGKKIFAVKQNRYNPPVQVAKKLMQENALGKIYLVQVNCFWNRNDQYYKSGEWRGKKEKDGGCLFTQFSHFIDILYYLIGAVKPLYGSAQNYFHQHNTEIEDTGCFVMKGENDALINFNFTTNAYEQNMEGSLTLMGEKGTLKIGGQYLNTIEYSKIENQVLPAIQIQAKENDYGSYKGSMSNHDKVIQNVIDVLERNESMMTSAADGRAVVAIIEAMYQSIPKTN